MRQGDISLAVEIPPGFGRELKRGDTPQIGFWVDGAMPTRADTVKGYVQGIHQSYLQDLAEQAPQGAAGTAFDVALRYRYNPDVQSLQAMVPAEIPILLMMIPAMLTALGVVRETGFDHQLLRHTGDPPGIPDRQAVALYRLGHGQLFMLVAFSVWVFDVPIKGSMLTLTLGALLYVTCATGLGLLISSVLNSQIAAIFGTAIATLVPATQFSGLIYPVSARKAPAP